MDVPIHIPNVVEFQALIDELKNHNSLDAQCFEERMATQTKILADQVKFMAEKTKAMSDYAQTLITAIDEHAKTIIE